MMPSTSCGRRGSPANSARYPSREVPLPIKPGARCTVPLLPPRNENRWWANWWNTIGTMGRGGEGEKGGGYLQLLAHCAKGSASTFSSLHAINILTVINCFWSYTPFFVKLTGTWLNETLSSLITRAHAVTATIGRWRIDAGPVPTLRSISAGPIAGFPNCPFGVISVNWENRWHKQIN